jgi:P-type Cu+ transporter
VVTETMAVAGMTCGGCEQRVHDAVMALPGVVSVTAEHIGDEVEVTFDPVRLDVKAISDTIAAAGYRPLPSPSQPWE